MTLSTPSTARPRRSTPLRGTAQPGRLLPLLLLAFLLLALLRLPPAAHAQVPIDLNTWSQRGPASNGDWNVSEDGSSVVQQINGSPTFFVSPESFLNTTINGSFGVEGSGDDDYIGVVFGFQTPDTTAGSGALDFEFLLFDWKQNSQSFGGGFASEGFNLVKVDEQLPTNPDYIPHYWSHDDDPPAFNVLDTSYADDRGWEDNETYDFELVYNEDRITISIAGGTGPFAEGETIFDITAAEAGVAAFPAGRFGFYNYSQDPVRYQGFTLNNAPVAQDDAAATPPATPVNIDVLANDTDPDAGQTLAVSSIASGPGDGTAEIDTDGTVTYTPDAGFTGQDTFVYAVSDGAGGTDEATVTVTVSGVVINEFLADPAGTVDANGDGSADDAGDEFVEVFNHTDSAVDLTGYALANAGGDLYAFPDGTSLASSHAATVFGGGAPTGVAGVVGTGLPGLDDAGGTIYLIDAAGDTLDAIGYAAGEASGVSLARNVNGAGPFEPQDTFGPMTPETAGDNNNTGEPLPVEFAGAPEASVEGRAVTLRWTTLSETGNAGFYVEYRPAGGAHEQGGWTAANDAIIAGAGTASSAHTYRYTAEDVAPGRYTFRVRQVDVDDDARFSPTVEVEVSAADFTLRAPSQNPFRNRTVLRYSAGGRAAGAVEAALYNSLGQKVRRLTATAGRIEVRAEGLASGLYFVLLKAGDRVATQSVVLVR